MITVRPVHSIGAWARRWGAVAVRRLRSEDHRRRRRDREADQRREHVDDVREAARVGDDERVVRRVRRRG